MRNPLLFESDLEFELPPFEEITTDHVREALTVGMAQQLAALAAIAADTSPPSLANTLQAWERSDATLRRTLSAFWVAKAADCTPAREEVEREFAPALAAHGDAILLNRGLFERLCELSSAADRGEVVVDAQDRHLLNERLREFRRGGINLDQAAQRRLREINQRLAELSTSFEHQLVAGRNAAAVHVTDEARLRGMASDDKARAREAARARDLGGWLVELTNTTGQPALDSMADRGLRAEVFQASLGRGLRGAHDTRAMIVQLVRLRAERAQLLGFDHHAAYVAADGCARTTQAVNDLLAGLVPGVSTLAHREAADLAARLAADDPGAELQAWDWQFYAAQAAAERAVDHERLRPYFPFDTVLVQGVFAAATALYGITFQERADLVGYTPQARVFEVLEADGTPLGAVIADPYTRATKQGGAWMTSVVDQNQLLDQQPVVTNTCNFPPPTADSPSLLSWDNVITLFHEFGHNLHGLLSEVRYPSRSGTSVPRDFVEFPSQINEIWAWHPVLLERYARHVDTGEPLPADTREALLASRRQGMGYATYELLAAMLLDQAWHQTPLADLPATAAQVEQFEAAALERAGVDLPLIPPRYRSAYFSHVFAGGYSAAYYSYLWSEVMDADTAAWFAEHGGLDREAGELFRRKLLSRGGAVEVMDAYRDFRGGNPDLAHLLARIGLS
ncbi:MAG: M3 family metallopeptidase [Arachnia sp.]